MVILMGLKENIDKALDEILKPYTYAKKVLNFLRTDKEVSYKLDVANTVAVQRLGYTDHGAVHGRIVAFNAAKALLLLNKRGVIPTLLKEDKKATLDDAIEVVLTAGYLHDVGNAIMRDSHELMSFELSEAIVNRIYSDENIHNERKKALILEGILCHMGTYKPTSLEAKIIPVADGCDMEQGRARIPYAQGKKDIHALSALAIKMVRIREGEKKPLKVYVEMDNDAGVFQIEENLLKKIKDAGMEKYVELSAFISSRNETIEYLKD